VNIGVPSDKQQDQLYAASATPTTSGTEPSSSRHGQGKEDHCPDQADEECNILKSLFDAQGIHVSNIFFISLRQISCLNFCF
jgi:DNA excision repair protein ERCC-6